MFFNIFSHKTNVDNFLDSFIWNHFLKVAIRAVLRIRLPFEANSMKESVAMYAFE